MKQILTSDNKRIAYSISGSGNALVLIHGFGEDRRIWETMLRTLEQHANVINIDLPGVGGSDVPDGEPSLDVYADAIALVMKHENISSAHVVGHSMGGYTAMALLEHYPNMVNALCLFHSQPFADDEARKTKREKDIDFIKRLGSEAFIKVLIPALFAEKFKTEHANVVNDLVERYKNLNPEGLVYALAAMKNRKDRSELLRNFTKSFLLISGVQDQVINMEAASKICQLSPVTQTLFLRDVAHMGMIESAENCTEQIVTWINL